MRVIKFSFIILMLLVIWSCVSSEKKEMESNLSNKETPLFELIDPLKSSVFFNNRVKKNFQNFFTVFNYVYNGAGVAVGDINNDGLSDIYFVGNEVSNKLYLNKGNFQFDDITKSANVTGGKGWHNGVVMADVNGDGFQDLYICKGGHENSESKRENLLYINQGDLTFKEEALKYGLNDNGFSLMASFFDADNDNDLDLYLVNRPSSFHLPYTTVLEGKTQQKDVFRDKLYINKNGTYKEIGISAGITNNFGYGLGLVTSDINEDGKIDILVSNDFIEKDYWYINQGNNTFKDELKSHVNHTAFYGMGMDVVDFNNDGLEDVIQLDMLPESYERSKTSMASMNPEQFEILLANGFYYQSMHNVLQLNRGKGFFSDVGQYAGLSKTDWSWSCLGSDFDNDGYRDLFVTNGFKRDIRDKDAMKKYHEFLNNPELEKSSVEQNTKKALSFFKQNKLPNYIFKNNGDLTFSKKTEAWGLGQSSLSNGAVTADLDNDGDLDLVVNNMDEVAFLYENKAENLANNYLKIKLNGPVENTTGLGAKVSLKYKGKEQFQEFKTVRGYLSSVEPILHFGLGEVSEVDEVEVIWSDGKRSNLGQIKTNRQIEVNYKGALLISPIQEKITPIFRDDTETAFKTPFNHNEIVYNDYKDQLLLPHKLSQSGPCIEVADVNNDGLEDFFVGGAAKQSGQLYLQNSKGEFSIKSQETFVFDAKHEDVGASFFDADGDEDIDLYVVSGSYEFHENDSQLQDRLYLNDGKGNFSKSKLLPEFTESGSCVVPFDFDSDGDLDLFIGGRLVSKKYPKAPNSYILENAGGIFKDVTSIIAPELSLVGMVTSAVAADIDGDEIKELIIVGEWMPISVFKKDNISYKNVTAKYNLLNTNGWWNKIVASDIDKDGDTDFIIGNLGLNYKFKASKSMPFSVYANDFDKNGTQDVFLAKQHKNREVPIRGKECMSQQLPRIGEKYKNYSDFAKADLKDIIGEGKETALKYQSQEFASVILENDNGYLRIKKLPSEAQLSVVNGIIVYDFNCDNINDILIAGNKFEVEVETTRADASIGQLFLGTKSGEFTTESYLKSGYFMPYNVKDLKKINIGIHGTGILTGVNDGSLRFHKTIRSK